MTPTVRDGLLRTLAFHATWGHAPTAAEWIGTCDNRQQPTANDTEVGREISDLEASGAVLCRFGRYVFSDQAALIDRIRENEFWNARKVRAAQKVARWLSRLSSVRFVALCNTTALGHARDRGDLDFFIVTRAGAIMSTRGLGVLPFKLARRRPGEGDKDAVCLSYFVTDDALDLSSHMFKPDDPYFRYWFLSLLPLYDDGVSKELWSANAAITSRHPFACSWIVPPDLRIPTPRFRFSMMRILEPLATRVQSRAFPPAIRDLMNRDTRVIVTDKALKFHVEDGREEYRRRYEEMCRERGIAI